MHAVFKYRDLNANIYIPALDFKIMYLWFWVFIIFIARKDTRCFTCGTSCDIFRDL